MNRWSSAAFGLLLILLELPSAHAAVGFALGSRFTLDTRVRPAEPGFAVGPAFELSTLRIEGRVLDQTTGAALAGATVTAPGFEARTGADGHFFLGGVKPGLRYTLTAFAPGYGQAQLEGITVQKGQSAIGLELRLRAVSGSYTVIPHWPPEGEVSSIMQGGTALRYFQMRDEAGQPGPPGVAVVTSLGGEPFSSEAGGIVVVEVPWSRIGSGRIGDQGRVEVTSVGGRDLPVPLSFAVEVQPRTYAVQWESDGYSRVGVSFINVEKGGGTSIRLEETDGDLTQFNQFEMGRELRSGVGAEAKVGAVAGVKMKKVKGAKIGIGASAEAGVEGMLSATSEDRYRFGYPERTTAQAMAQYALVGEGLIGDLSPQLVNLLGFVEGRLTGQNSLESAYVYGSRGLDLMGGARAEAEATAGVFGAPVRAGIEVGADAWTAGHGVLAWSEYPQAQEGSILVGLTGAGGAGGRAEVGFSARPGRSWLGATAFAGLEGAGEIGGSVEVFFSGNQARRLELTTRKQGQWGTTVGAEFLRGKQQQGEVSRQLAGQQVEVATAIVVEGIAGAIRQMLAADPLGQALVERRVENLRLGGATFQRLTEAMSTAAQRLQEAGQQLSISYAKEVRLLESERGGEIQLKAQVGASALRVAFAQGKTTERQRVVAEERGVWIRGELRPTEVYAEDAFTPGTDRTMASLVQEIHDAMGNIAAEAFRPVAQAVKAGAETVVEMGKSTLKVAADALSGGVREIGALTWSWWGPSPSAKPGQLSAAEYAVRAKIAALAQQAARLDYGIGGFYQLTPPGEVLAAPAELTIAYQDEEVQGMDEVALAVYTYDQETGEWLLVGGQVDPANNTVTAPISVLGVYTLAPRIPSGEFELRPDQGSLPANGTSTAAVLSDTIWNNDGTSVTDGTLFDVWTTSGALAGIDADPTREGFQVAAQGGRLRFQVQAGLVALPAEIVARSAVGKAVGRTTLEFTDSSPPAAPIGLVGEWNGQAVALRWRANPEPDLAGYRIYYQEGRAGPPYEGTAAPPGQPSPIAVGPDTTAQVLGLQAGQTYYFALSARDILGNESGYSAEVLVNATITAVEEKRGQVVPGEYQLWPNFPNPFNATTTLRYAVPRAGRVELSIYDILGRQLRTLVNEEVAAGTYTALWDGKDERGRQAGSGVYFSVLRAGQVRRVQRLVLLR